MKRVWIVLLSLVVLWVPADMALTGERDSETGAIVADSTLVFTLEIGSRIYEKWSEEHAVTLGEMFYIGDTPYTGVVDAFTPDLKIKDGKIFSASEMMVNPAARVITFEDTTAVDTTWSFLNLPPHFKADDFFVFKLRGVKGYVEPAGEPATDASNPPERESSGDEEQ